MSAYEKILCCIDGSRASLHAAMQSLELVAPEGTLTLLVVVMPGFCEEPDQDTHVCAPGGEAEKTLADAASGVLGEAHRRGLGVELRVSTGKAHERIAERAEADGAGLVVLGLHEESGLKRRLLGGTASRVIAASESDVLVVPVDARLGRETVMAAMDGSPEGRRAARRAMDVAEALGARLRIVSVVPERTAYPAELLVYGGYPLARMTSPRQDVADNAVTRYVERETHEARAMVDEARDKAMRRGIEAEALVVDGDPWRKLVSEADMAGAGLLVMGSRGRTGLQRLLLGSVVQRVVEHASCPVLVAT